MTFDAVFDLLLSHEGGYVNDPRDPGGETKYGISKRSYPRLDIANLTREEAKAIYKVDFWDRAQCESFNGAIGFQVFDTAVNSGIETAVRMLQRAVGVADDGHVGGITLAAIQSMHPCMVVALFNAERLEFMTKLSVWDRFGRGWARRIADNLKQLKGA